MPLPPPRPARRPSRILLFTAILLVSAAPLAIYFTSRSAEAQCGSSASSCKSCHEVQGQDPVNASGEWHTAHAFGDFCEFCHAGNVQAKDQDTAHVGLVEPMVDVKASCQSCHPDDFQQKAEFYATALGIEIGSGGTGGANGGSGDSAGAAAPEAGAPAETGAASTEAAEGASAGAAGVDTVGAVALPSGLETIDYNELYAASLLPERLFGSGDWVTIAVIGLLLLGLLFAIWKLEHLGDRLAHWWQQNILPFSSDTVTQGAGAAALPMPGALGRAPLITDVPLPVPAELEELLRRRPELRQVWPSLVRADATTLLALARLLPQPEAAALLQRVGTLNLALVAALQELSPADRALLIALAAGDTPDAAPKA